METTNGNSNPDLWKNLSPSTVFEPIRVMVASRLARSGREWTQLFAQYNSGTYVINIIPRQELMLIVVIFLVTIINGSLLITICLNLAVNSLRLTYYGYWNSYRMYIYIYISLYN